MGKSKEPVELQGAIEIEEPVESGSQVYKVISTLVKDKIKYYPGDEVELSSEQANYLNGVVILQKKGE
jgi:hypothetical protein